MRLHFTLDKFPATGALKEQCGLPFSCLVQPFAPHPDAAERVTAEDLARCNSCYAYANRHCHFDDGSWSCALCGHENSLDSVATRRYSRAHGRKRLPDLQSDFFEAVYSSDAASQEGSGEEKGENEEAQPVYLAMVDTSCGEEFLEVVKTSLLAALEALPSVARFGLITFSNKVGLHSVQGRTPVVRYVSLIEDGGDSPTPLDLVDALPLGEFLAPLDACKERVAAAIDLLKPEGDSPWEASLDSRDPSPPRVSRGLGGCLQAVLRYLGSGDGFRQGGQGARGPNDAEGASEGPASDLSPLGLTGARMMLFLAGPPNLGRGATVRVVETHQEALGTSAGEEVEDGLGVLPDRAAQGSAHGSASRNAITFTFQPDESAAAFYDEAAVAATAVGVAVDIYAVSPVACGLDMLGCLAGSSGGSMYLYPSLENAALPQDVYRRLASPQAVGGMLRLRTSPEFRVARSFGQLFPDGRYDNLAHLVACDASATFAFDLEFTRADGFSDSPDNPPVLQAAFQYSIMVPAGTPPPQENGGDAKIQRGPRYVWQRRLRILTLPTRVADRVLDVFAHANAEAISVMLVHKVGRVAASGGLEEAGSLLRSWTILTCAKFNAARPDPPQSAEEVDTSFGGAPKLWQLPRLCYALLQSPLLAAQPRGNPHPDLRSVLQHLWEALPPDLLSCAVYPRLSSYRDPDNLSNASHALSRDALIAAGAPIFLLDSFSAIYLYYAVGCPPGLHFPPPQNSLLRGVINSCRQNRRPTPSLVMIRGGFDDVQPFLNMLAEEAEVDGAGHTIAPGFSDFLDNLREQVWLYLKKTRK